MNCYLCSLFLFIACLFFCPMCKSILIKMINVYHIVLSVTVFFFFSFSYSSSSSSSSFLNAIAIA